MFCYVLFMYVAYNSPEEHPRITAAEKRYITQSLGTGAYKKVSVVGVVQCCYRIAFSEGHFHNKHIPQMSTLKNWVSFRAIMLYPNKV